MFAARQIFESSAARRNDGDAGLVGYKRLKIAGMKVVAVGKRCSVGKSRIERRCGAGYSEVGSSGCQQVVFTGASRRRRMLIRLFRQ